MRCRAVVTVLGCVLLGGVAQALVACVLALRSPMVVPAMPVLRVVLRDRDPSSPDGKWIELRDDPGRGGWKKVLDLWPPAGVVPPHIHHQTAGYQSFDGVGVIFVSGQVYSTWTDATYGPQWSIKYWQAYRAGWPMRSMAATVDETGTLRGGLRAPNGWMAADRSTISLSRREQPIRAVIPLRPRPLGTAVNSLVFSAPFLLVLLARAARRRRRARAGRCLRCGYSRAGLAGSAPCPECGFTPADGSHCESGGGVGAAAPASADLEGVAGPDKGVEEQGAHASAEE